MGVQTYYQTAIHTLTAKIQRKLCLGTWNARTMAPGMSPDYDLINDSRKSAVIDRELAKRSVDIAALQDTRLLEKFPIRELVYTIYWSEKPVGCKSQHVVGLAVKNTLCRTLEGTHAISLEKGDATIMCIRANVDSSTRSQRSLLCSTCTSS